MGEMSIAGKSIMVQNKDVLREVLKSEKDPQVKRKLSFLSLVGMEVEEAVAHFGVCVSTGYNWIHCWNSEDTEVLRLKKIPGRPPRLDEEMLEVIPKLPQ